MDTITFIQQFPRISFTKGEVILNEGDVSDSLLAIVTGYVKVSSIDNQGNDRLLWIAGRYDIAPTERLFSSSRPLQFFYTALTDGIAYKIDKSQYLAFAKTDLTAMTEIATNMSSHYDDLLLRIQSIEQDSVRHKLIATLRYLAGRFSADETVDLYQLGLRVTHQDLASMIGSTRETTSLELQKLRKDGFIDYNSGAFIIYLDRCVVS